MVTYIYTNDIEPVIEWLRERGHRTRWYSRNHTYIGLYDRWRIESQDAVQIEPRGRRWSVRIKDPKLYNLFVLRWR